MQQGPISKQGSTHSFIRRDREAGAEDKKAGKNASEVLQLTDDMRVDQPQEQSQKAAPEEAPATEAHAEPKDEVTYPLGVVMKVTPEALRTTDDGKGGLKSAMTLAFVEEDRKAEFEKQGAIFPEVGNAVLGDGIGPEGTIEVVPVHDTQDPGTKNVARTLTVDSHLLDIDPETGQPKIESYTPALLGKGEGVLPSGKKAVDQGANVVPEGYVGELATSQKGLKELQQQAKTNQLMKTLGSFAQSSLAGIFTVPVVSEYASILAVGQLGFTYNETKNLNKAIEDQLGYLEEAKKKSPNDLVTMQTADGTSFKVSAKNEEKRLDAQMRKANRDKWSSRLLALSGTTSIVGKFAAAGVGVPALAAASTVAPWIAGGAMLLGNGGMIFDSISELKELSAEKAKLEKLQEQGETHIEQVVEIQDGKLGRVRALGDEMVEVPIDQRLKQVEKQQRQHRLIATAMSGGALSLGNMVAGLAPVMSVGMLAMAPAGVLFAGQSIKQLSELGKERKELEAAKESGKTMVERETQQADGSWEKQRIPISVLLEENKKARNKQKMYLTAVGSAGAMAGLTLGAGMSFLAAAPVLLVPAAIGAVLFPDKVKEFAEKVKGIIDGTFGEAGKTKRNAKKETEARTDQFFGEFKEQTAALREKHPKLFAEKANKGEKFGGPLFEVEKLMKQYSQAANPMERQNTLKHVDAILKELSSHAADEPELQGALQWLNTNVQDYRMDVEAEWVARDITLEMKTPVTEKVVNNPKVKSRLKELDFSTDNVREQYEESLYIENTPQRFQELLQGSRAGDRDAARVLTRGEVFKAARILATKERDLGVDLYTRYLDAIQQPEDQDNHELLIKEVGYKQERPVTAQGLQSVADAYRTLNTPLNMAPLTKDDPFLNSKLSTAIQEMRQADPENTAKLLEFHQKGIDGKAFEGMTAQEAFGARVKINAQFSDAKRALRKSAPEALKAWTEADDKLREAVSPEKAGKASKGSTLTGPAARMDNAYQGLLKKEPELAKKLNDRFSLLNNPVAYEGLTPQEIQQKKIEVNSELNKIREDLHKKEPVLVELWDEARDEVLQAHFERTVDHDAKKRILGQPAVQEKAEELGLGEEAVESLYMALMHRHILSDSRPLEREITAEDGESADQKKVQMLDTIDLAMVKMAALEQQNPRDLEELTERKIAPGNDPKVQMFLRQNPQLVQAMQSPGFQELANKLGVSPQEMANDYLALLQADLNPVAKAELEGRIKGGDVAAARTNQVGTAAAQYILQSTRPAAGQLQQMVDNAMEGPAVQTILSNPQVQAKGEEFGLDPGETMRSLLELELGRQPEVFQELVAKAQKGDQEAAAKVNFMQVLTGALQAVNQQLQAQTAA